MATAASKTTSHVSEQAAYEEFLASYPAFKNTYHLDDLRASEYRRLDDQKHLYLDYTGGSLYGDIQLREHMELLRQGVFGNPHSSNPTSKAMTQLDEHARQYVLRHFNASPDEYVVVFTPNASGALKLVGESYPFAPGGRYVLTFDNHNSVNGIREFARHKGAEIVYIPVLRPELRVDEEKLFQALNEAQSGQYNLLAYPAQSNFSGVQHPLEWVERARAMGWDVLVDFAAFVPTNRLDLSQVKPDFLSLSFYKMFGYPTGIGCLIARKAALAKLRRPWFAGGTITLASVQGDGYYLAEGEAGFEDGTINYLTIPAVEIGLKHIEAIGIDVIHERVSCLTGWLLNALLNLHHRNGAPLIRLYGPADMYMRGGTVSFNLLDAQGNLINFRQIEARANAANISLRTGCFCNPGAGEVANNLTREDMSGCFREIQPMSFDEFLTFMDGKATGAVRVSLGLVSNFSDVYRFIQFVETYRE
jgi:selenocysteine lyase/cysteine desulfurase